MLGTVGGDRVALGPLDVALAPLATRRDRALAEALDLA